MSIGELFVSTYGWFDARSSMIAATVIAVPLVGTLLAWIGRGGKTDRDGRAIANASVGIAVAIFVVEVAAVLVARIAFHANILEASALLLAAPIVGLAATLFGIHLVFPLNELASMKTIRDVGLFVGAALAVLWAVSQFRGWGIVFWGDLTELVIIGAAGYYLMKRLYGRAFG